MNDFLTEYVQSMHKRMSEEMENAIINFLQDKGYTIGEDKVASIIAIQEELSKSNRTLKCEWFMKFDDAVDGDRYSFTGLCVPYIDALDTPMTRAELYEVLRLQEKGYSYRGEHVWL